MALIIVVIAEGRRWIKKATDPHRQTQTNICPADAGWTNIVIAPQFRKKTARETSAASMYLDIVV